MTFFIYTIDNSSIINRIFMKRKLFWKSLLLSYVHRQELKQLKQFEKTWNMNVFAKGKVKHVCLLLHNCMSGNLHDNPFGNFKELKDVVRWAQERYVLFRDKAMQNNKYSDCEKAVFYALAWSLAKQIVARREMCDLVLSRPSF